jgi:hypothetical protein
VTLDTYSGLLERDVDDVAERMDKVRTKALRGKPKEKGKRKKSSAVTTEDSRSAGSRAKSRPKPNAA